MSAHIERQAADWLARRNGGLSAAEAAELRAWLTADPRHAAALAALEQTWEELGAVRRSGQAERLWIEVEACRRQRRRRRRRAWGAAVGVATAVALMAALPWPKRPAPAGVESAAADPGTTVRRLADGSTVAVRAGAVIEVDLQASVRRVRLLRGEALFSVAEDPARPFLVESGRVGVRAVGTEFSVAHGHGSVTVLVVEGRVAVSSRPHQEGATADDEAGVILAGPGDRVQVPAAGVEAGARTAEGNRAAVSRVPAEELRQALAWRGERLEFSDTPLEEAIRAINRGRRVPIVLADPRLQRRTVTGVVWSGDSDEPVRLLEAGFGLIAERSGGVIRLRARE